MEAISPLIDEFSRLLSWKQSQIEFLAKFVIALIKRQTVNLVRISHAFHGSAKPESHYKKIQRFLSWSPLDFDSLATLLVSITPLGDSWTLTLDRTNWKYGELNINILVLAIACNDIAIPIFWVFLPKRGNSNTSERIELMTRFLRVFGSSKIKCLTADREFIGREWIRWLKANHIPFRIRIRRNTQVSNRQCGKPMDAYLIFRGLKFNEYMALRTHRKIWGIEVHLACLKTTEDYVILISDHDPKGALDDYRQRWQIETLFGCLKTRGFNLEDTHLQDLEKVNILLGLLAIAFCWAYLVGDWCNQNNPIKLKKHGRKAASIFRVGLSYIENALFNLDCKWENFQKALEVLALNFDLNAFLSST